MVKRSAKEDVERDSASTGKKQKKDVTDKKETSPIAALETAYRTALAAFKKDKTNKDLRRAKSSAKKAWDAAIAATCDEGDEQLQCKDCSHMFIFTVGEQEFYAEQSWNHKPTRCHNCNESYKARLMDRSTRDSKGKNMCHAFTRGECKHGDQCKFSHHILKKEDEEKEKNPEGEKKQEEAEKGVDFVDVPSYKKGECFAFQRGACPFGEDCRFNHIKKAQ